MKAVEAVDPNRLSLKLKEAGSAPLDQEQIDRFHLYLDLILKWNARTNLTAVREPNEIIERHFVESVLCARLLPASRGSLLDLGSGAGFPGIPIAICRPDLDVTLAESQNKKAAFLNEAVRVLGLNAKVFTGRAERLDITFDCVALRAVDNMSEAIGVAVTRLRPLGLLVLMVSDTQEGQLAAIKQIAWEKPVPVPGAMHRVICLGIRE